jgi:hypothetical protein
LVNVSKQYNILPDAQVSFQCINMNADPLEQKWLDEIQSNIHHRIWCKGPVSFQKAWLIDAAATIKKNDNIFGVSTLILLITRKSEGKLHH